MSSNHTRHLPLRYQPTPLNQESASADTPKTLVLLLVVLLQFGANRRQGSK